LQGFTNYDVVNKLAETEDYLRRHAAVNQRHIKQMSIWSY